MSLAYVEYNGGSFYEVWVGLKFVCSYSSRDNAVEHARQINEAIARPRGLNQRRKKAR
jgi:hypothetical protein